MIGIGVARLSVGTIEYFDRSLLPNSRNDVTLREVGQKTTYSGAVQDEDLRLRHYRRDPIGPRVSLFLSQTFQPGASLLPRQGYPPAPPLVGARQQNSLEAHPIGRENPSFPRVKRAAPPARQSQERLQLRRMRRRQR